MEVSKSIINNIIKGVLTRGVSWLLTCPNQLGVLTSDVSSLVRTPY